MHPGAVFLLLQKTPLHLGWIWIILTSSWFHLWVFHVTDYFNIGYIIKCKHSHIFVPVGVPNVVAEIFIFYPIGIIHTTIIQMVHQGQWNIMNHLKGGDIFHNQYIFSPYCFSYTMTIYGCFYLTKKCVFLCTDNMY